MLYQLSYSRSREKSQSIHTTTYPWEFVTMRWAPVGHAGASAARFRAGGAPGLVRRPREPQEAPAGDRDARPPRGAILPREWAADF